MSQNSRYQDYQDMISAIQNFGGFIQEMWAKEQVAIMIRELLVAGHMRLTESGDAGHPAFIIMDAEGEVDRMPVTTEQHEALSVLKNRETERRISNAENAPERERLDREEPLG